MSPIGPISSPKRAGHHQPLLDERVRHAQGQRPSGPAAQRPSGPAAQRHDALGDAAAYADPPDWRS
jgi:hypothetical protein